jgi:hypothetical protein
METRQINQAFSKEFILAGNAIVTFKSRRTGNHMTYKITKADNGAVWFVSVMYGGDDFQYIGIIDKEMVFKWTKKSRVDAKSPSFMAFAWSWSHLYSDQLEVWHEGRCGKCGKRLTEPESVERGFGPVCWEKISSGLLGG